MQPLASFRILAPRLPRRQKVEPEAEARFEDRERAPAAPALGQAVAGEKHMPRLREPALGAVVEVAELGRIRRAALGEREARGQEWRAHARSGGGREHPNLALRRRDHDSGGAELLHDRAVYLAARLDIVRNADPRRDVDRNARS